MFAHGRWFSPGTPASSTTKPGRHDIVEILLKVALSTINQINKTQYSSITEVVNSGLRFGLWCFNATFNNISIILWRSVLLVQETGVPEENHQPAASHWQPLSHYVVSSTPRLSEIRTYSFSAYRHRLHRQL